MSLANVSARISLRNILVATDFSQCSERALLHAVAAAHHFGSTLHVVHVVPTAAYSFASPEAYLGTHEMVARAVELTRTDTEAMLAGILRRCRCEQVQHRSWVRAGEVEETLHSMIRQENIDLVVVGNHGRIGLRKIVLGSVAEDVFRRAPCPVLTVGPHSWQSDPQSVRLKHVLFPTDFSEDSARALPFAISLAADFDAAMTVMHVVERLDTEAAHDRLRVVNALEDRMREMVASLGPMPPGVDFQVEFGDVAETVIQSATHLGADLIAFGLKAPDTYVDRLPWMQAYKIVCEAGCPVLRLRGRSARQED